MTLSHLLYSFPHVASYHFCPSGQIGKISLKAFSASAYWAVLGIVCSGVEAKRYGRKNCKILTAILVVLQVLISLVNLPAIIYFESSCILVLHIISRAFSYNQ